MKARPNNMSRNVLRTKSPVVVSSRFEPSPICKPIDRGLSNSQAQIQRFSSSDSKIKVKPRNEPQTNSKNNNLLSSCKQPDICISNILGRNANIEKNRKSIKEEEDNTTQTQQSSSQHISYVAGEYQLDNYDLFYKKKNVKFQQKVVQLEGKQKLGQRTQKNSSSRNSSILKNCNRMLDRSIATSSQKSISIQNSFTAIKKVKIGIGSNENIIVNATRRKYQTIIENIKEKNKLNSGQQIRQKYIDDLFPPVESSLFNNSVYQKNHASRGKQEIIWMRITEIFDKKTIKVYSKTKRSDNIITNENGFASPYLCCSFNTIKNCNELLSHIFQNEEISPYGVYLVRIYQQNTWKYVIVDDLIPCIKRRKRLKREDKYQPAFINIHSEQSTTYIWPFLLEKAYANYYNCYQNLGYGNVVDFLSELTGSPYSEIILTKKNSKPNVKLDLDVIQKFMTKQNRMAIGWSQQKQAFCSIDLVKDNYISDNCLFKYTQPLSNETVTFQLHKIASLFTAIYLFGFNIYENTSACPVYPPKSIRQRVKRPKEKQDKKNYIQIAQNDTISVRTFTLLKKTMCCLDIRQKQNRFYYQCGINDYLWVRCLFLQKEYDGGFRWIKGKYSNKKHIIFEENLQPGQYYLIIMVEWRQKHSKQLTIVLHSDCDFLKLERKNYIKEEHIIQLACMDLAQRYGKLSQINKSICAYTYLCEETALIIENINNQRTKGDVAIMRSINGLKSKVQILPINHQFEVDLPEEYGTIEKGNPKKVIGQSLQIDIKKGESFTVVLRMRGGIDSKFFKAFNFG